MCKKIINSSPKFSFLLILVNLTCFSNQPTLPLTDTTKTYTIPLDTLNTEIKKAPTFWKNKNSIGLNFNEVAFINWNSGGNNSISALFHGKLERNYQKKLLSWKTSSSLRIGLNAQEGRALRKSEDRMQLNSTFGYGKDSTSNFQYSAKLNFNTQFAKGYKYPNTEKPISKFMAPGYLFIGIGTEYSNPHEDLNLYLSPLTQKSTFVLDSVLANEGTFGVTPAIRDEEGKVIKEGEKVQTELGVLLTSGFNKEIFTSINLNNKVSLYSDYINNFGNIDVDWQLNVNMEINEFVKASIGTHLRYDDDVKFKEDITGDGKMETLGARVQFKQLLGIGVAFDI